MLVDSHCHVDFPDLAADLPGVVDRAREAGIGHMLCVSVNLTDFPRLCEVTQAYPEISWSVGVHPNEAFEANAEPSSAQLAALADHPRVVAVGETGLDYYRSEAASQWQRDRFAAHVAAAKQCAKPLIVHTRQAAADTLDLMRAEHAHECGGVMHCFSEDWETAKASLDEGFYISFSGIVTFKNAEALREVARKTPIDRILVETDAPYLAPHPFRGKVNEPALVVHTARCVAEIKGMDEEVFADVTTENFKKLFSHANVEPIAA